MRRKTHLATYVCLECLNPVREKVSSPRAMRSGICPDCATEIIRITFPPRFAQFWYGGSGRKTRRTSYRAYRRVLLKMAEFTPAVEYVLANEGGTAFDSIGGLTKFGISQAEYPQLDISSLTRDEAILIYQRDYWKFGGFTSQRVASKMLDIYVNLPPAEAIRLLQQSLGFLQAGPIVVDGILGPQTTEHVNAADEGELIDELKARLAIHYFQKSDPSRQLGLIRRAVKG